MFEDVIWWLTRAFIVFLMLTMGIGMIYWIVDGFVRVMRGDKRVSHLDDIRHDIRRYLNEKE